MMSLEQVQNPGERRWSATRLAFVFFLSWACLLTPAVYNRFPLLFPDTSAYLKVAYGGHWTIDRSGFYGLFFQPLLRFSETELGLWLVIAVQAAVVGAILVAVARKIAPSATPATICGMILATALLTSAPWHAAQLMPDAFTGALILTVWLAASRDVGASGTPLLWLLTVCLALTHYTHLPLMAAVGIATFAFAAFTLTNTEVAKRFIA